MKKFKDHRIDTKKAYRKLPDDDIRVLAMMTMLDDLAEKIDFIMENSTRRVMNDI